MEKNIKAKIGRTPTYFPLLEKEAQNLWRKAAKQYRLDKNIAKKFPSVTQYCYYLLLGGTLDEVLKHDKNSTPSHLALNNMSIPSVN